MGENEVFSRDKTAIGKELNIYLPNYSIAIEPGSWGFHKEKRKSDENKAKLCEKHQIKLITIYTGYKDKAINSPNVFCYAQNLSRKSERKELIGLFYRILEYTGVSIQFDENKWDEISNIAYINSRRTTTDTFKEKLSAVNPTISVLGEYKSSKEKVLCRCDICGYEWNVTPGDLLSGRGCPLCAKKRRGELRKYSQETFVTLVSERNPNIEILGSYSGSKDQIACKCKLCGYVWAPPAGSLISARKRGCPNCARVVKQNAKASQKL